MKSFIQFLEDRFTFSADGFDKKAFPEVNTSYMQYSKASREALKKIAEKFKIDDTGSKASLITKILEHLHGPNKVAGFYNKRSETPLEAYKREKLTAKPASYKPKKYSKDKDV